MRTALCNFAGLTQVKICPLSVILRIYSRRVVGWHVEDAVAKLKEWLRPFHGVATKYLDTYQGWRRIAEARGGGVQPADWLRSAVGVGWYQ